MALPFPTAHRPFPVPNRPWIMRQRWHDLLFAHWPLPAESLRPLIPKPLSLDTFEGQAWIGVVPFRMSGIRPRLLPALPWLSAFPELNVRTYVTMRGKPGVYFFSLDAANPVAVRTARSWFCLPYLDATMTCVEKEGWIHYTSARANSSARFEARYQANGAITQTRPGSLEHWLTERYCMYPQDRGGRLHCGHIHHAPWPVQSARAEIAHNTMLEPLGLVLPNSPPLLHFSRELDVVAWGLERVTED